MDPDSTCWTIIREAAAGEDDARERFARHYLPVVRAYLGHRWGGTPCAAEVDDAIQEVFVECFRRGGVLERVDASRSGGFRAFLYGVVRNVALRAEGRRSRQRECRPDSRFDPAEMEQREPTLSRIFDRAWAKAILREATEVQERRARKAGADALRRLKLLAIRFQEDLPIREIAKRWEVDAARLHHEYARARQEFREALAEVVAFHHPGTPGEIDRQCSELLALFD